jgi:hypothetical protein
MEFTTRFELHSQTTRLFESASQRAGRTASETGFSPSATPRSRGLVRGPALENASPDYNSDGRGPSDYKFELFPLHSPLLGESLLVSFPPLIDMLKFGG